MNPPAPSSRRRGDLAAKTDFKALLSDVTMAAAWVVACVMVATTSVAQPVLLPFGVDTHDQLQAAFRDALKERADALLVDTSLSAAFRDQQAFHAFAQHHRLPVMHTYANAVTTA
jgi:hypothetical protein